MQAGAWWVKLRVVVVTSVTIRGIHREGGMLVRCLRLCVVCQTCRATECLGVPPTGVGFLFLGLSGLWCAGVSLWLCSARAGRHVGGLRL